MNTNRSKNSINKSYQLSKQFGFDPEREAQIFRLAEKTNDTKIYEFDEMKRYQQIRKPFVGQEKKKMIQEKLQLDKTAYVQAIARIKQDNMFISYERNPFIQAVDLRRMINAKQQGYSDINHNYNHQKFRKEVEKEKDIVKAINKLSHKEIQTQFNPKAQRWQQLQRLTLKNLKNLNKKDYKKFSLEGQEFQQQKVRETTFDDIIQKEEQNFYDKNHQIDINLFQVIKGNQKTFLNNSILDKYYFCHNSMMDKITTLRFPIHRDLSRIGRKFVMDHRYKQPLRIDNISSNQISFKLTEVRFLDLLSVASGRFTPQIIYKSSKDIEVREDNNSIKSDIYQLEVSYEDNLKHKTTLFETEQIQQMEKIDYLRLQNTKGQEKYAQKCQKMMKYVQSQLQKKAQFTGKTIKDKLLHRQVDKNVNFYIQYMADMDYKKDETQKIIRKNKLSKDRNEAIKITSLLNSIVLKNKQQQKIRILMQDKQK